LKEDLAKFKEQEMAKTPIVLQQTTVQEDPSGAYTYQSEVHDLKNLAQ
jgi:hypothetical protein